MAQSARIAPNKTAWLHPSTALSLTSKRIFTLNIHVTKGGANERKVYLVNMLDSFNLVSKLVTLFLTLLFRRRK